MIEMGEGQVQHKIKCVLNTNDRARAPPIDKKHSRGYDEFERYYSSEDVRPKMLTMTIIQKGFCSDISETRKKQTLISVSNINI